MGPGRWVFVWLPVADTVTLMRQLLLYPDKEGGGWVCEVPNLTGCVSQGDTKQEALDNVRGAIDAWIETAKSLGRPVPEDAQNVEICVV